MKKQIVAKKYLVWVHTDYEGWAFDAFKTLREAKRYAEIAKSETYRPKITKLLATK